MNIQKHFEFANKQAKEGHFFKDKAWPPIKSLIDEFNRPIGQWNSISDMMSQAGISILKTYLAPAFIAAGITYGTVGKAGAYLANLAKGPD